MTLPSDDTVHRQTPFEVAVVIATMLRPSLERAVRSVFAQDLKAHIQIVIGIDHRQGGDDCLERLARDRPADMCLTIIDLGYSTARRNGGLYPNDFGGALALNRHQAQSRHLLVDAARRAGNASEAASCLVEAVAVDDRDPAGMIG
ncbi:MAG: hypothetical protein WCC64_08260 [Aliidongia sp.]